MHIHCLGLSHHSAHLSLRERMALSDDKIRLALRRLASEQEAKPDGLSELVIISTCNRVELFAVSPAPESAPLLRFLYSLYGVHAQDFEPYLYHYADQAAVEHLYRVAAGLDSMVLGEPQILGQVTHALDLALSQKSGGPLLSRLFQSAIHAGKRTRAETHISRNSLSVSSLAASLAERAVPDLKTAHILIIGAGEMAELAVENLRKRGANQITVVNRTLARAQEFAERWNALLLTFEHLEQALEKADILISSTGAPHTIIHQSDALRILSNRQGRPLVAIDIAVPRDIDPLVGNLPGIHLYDLDSLNQQLEQSLAERMSEIPRVEEILSQEITRFMEYLETIPLLPLISHVRSQAETIRRHELEKTLRRLPDLTEAEIRRIEALTEALVKKLVDAPITRLRAEAQCPNSECVARVAGLLYSYQTSEHPCHSSSRSCQNNPGVSPNP